MAATWVIDSNLVADAILYQLAASLPFEKRVQVVGGLRYFNWQTPYDRFWSLLNERRVSTIPLVLVESGCVVGDCLRKVHPGHWAYQHAAAEVFGRMRLEIAADTSSLTVASLEKVHGPVDATLAALVRKLAGHGSKVDLLTGDEPLAAACGDLKIPCRRFDPGESVPA